MSRTFPSSPIVVIYQRLAEGLVALAPRQKFTVSVLADAAGSALAMLISVVLFDATRLTSGTASALICMAPLIVVPCLMGVGVYRAVARFSNGDLMIRIGVGVVLASFFALAVLQFVGSEDRPMRVIAIFIMAATLTLSGIRVCAGLFLRRRRGRAPARVLIYGAGQAGQQLATALRASGKFLVTGFVDDQRGYWDRTILGFRVFAPAQIQTMKEARSFDRILFAIPSATRARRRQILQSLESLAAHVMVVPSLDDIVNGRHQLDELRKVEIEDLLGREAVAPDEALMDAFIRDQSVMVTGAGGSIGAELCRQALRRGVRCLVLLEISEFALYTIEHELRELCLAQALPVRLVPVLASIDDERAVRAALAENQVDTIYHAAAYKHVPLLEFNVAAAVQNNVLGTWTLMRAAAAQSIRHVVLVSSDKAVRPTSVMGATKRASELILQACAAKHPAMRISMVRFGNVLASSGSVVPLFKEQIRAGGPVTVTHSDVTRYFMTLQEAAQLVIQAGALGSRGEVFVLDMGEPIRICDLARQLVALSGLTVRDAANPDGDIEITFTGLRPGEKLFEELLIGAASEPTAHPRIKRARERATAWGDLLVLVERASRAVRAGDPVDVLEVLSTMVAEFKPPAAGERRAELFVEMRESAAR